MLARRLGQVGITTRDSGTEAGGHSGRPGQTPRYNWESEMKRLAMAVLVLGLVSVTRGDDPPAKNKMMDGPGAEHKALAKMAGDYTTKSVMDMGGQKQESVGTAKIASHMDGRFIAEEGKGEMMGMPYSSHKMYGFNNAAKKYEGVWMYTGSTGMMTMTGTSSDGGRSILFTAAVDQGGQKQNFTITVKRMDDDHFTVEMKMPEGGPSMVTTYSRKK
jgi:hypothetical protein